MVLICWSAVCSALYVPVWQSNLTLWRHAVQHAPAKPRPWLNWGLAWMRAGELAAAEQAFLEAQRLASGGHVRGWDRDDVLPAAVGNLEALSRLEVVRGGQWERRP